MINIIFEDADGVPISDLLRSGFGVDVSIHFAGGVSNIRDLAPTLAGDTPCVIFMDLIPDNTMTAVEFRLTRRRLRKFKSVYIVPVVCTEYYVLKAFLYPQLCTPGYVISNVDYLKLSPSITSAEKYYKYLLDMQADCMCSGKYRNTRTAGLFYKSDCSCNGCSKSYTRASKALQLIGMFPQILPFDAEGIVTLIADREKEYNDTVHSLSTVFGWSQSEINIRLV